MTVTFSAFSTITGDTFVLSSNSVRRTILSNTKINFTTSSSAILSDALISNSTKATIFSSAQIQVNGVHLQLFKESDVINEIGTPTNPVIFASANAGEITPHPDNPFILYNDIDGTFDSTDAKNIAVELLEMEIIDEFIGTSDGTAGQTFTIAFAPIIEGDLKNPVRLRVGSVEWTEVTSLVGQSSTALVFTLDYVAGLITFGNNVNGAIPPNTQQIYVTYSPDTTRFGKEARDNGWLLIESFDVDSHNRVVTLVPSVVIDLSHVQAFHTPLIIASPIQGVWLVTDPNRLGTNYFTGGSFNDTTGVVTLGTALPFGTTTVLMDYTYRIANDAEVVYTQLIRGVIHTFTNPIPSKNGKKLNFAVTIPSGASPTNGVKVQFRLRFTYTEY